MLFSSNSALYECNRSLRPKRFQWYNAFLMEWVDGQRKRESGGQRKRDKDGMKMQKEEEKLNYKKKENLDTLQLNRKERVSLKG